jgi:predicted dehydrogenase
MSSRIKNLSAAVVGTGFIGPVHVEGLRRPGVQVAGFVGSSTEKSMAAAERLGLPRGYESFTPLT